MPLKGVMSPLECCLEIYAHRQTALEMRKNAKHREDQISAEADLVHFQNNMKECNGVGEVASGLSDKEMRALRAFFEMTCGYGWLRRGGWIGRAPSRKEKQIPFFAVDPANWSGVEINRPRSRVGKLLMGHNNLEGVVPYKSICALISLDTLQLQANELRGPVPRQLGHMSSLTDLNLAENHLEGAIPPEIGDAMQLTSIDLSANRLEGPLPGMLGDLVKLRVLKLDSNLELCGPLPEEYAELTGLVELSLAENKFDGPIPAYLDGMTGLVRLDLSHNMFAGPIPALPKTITALDLGHNRLEGRLAKAFCERHAPTLEVCFLNNNALERKVPDAIGLMTTLTTLNLAHNRFVGEVPRTVTDLTNIKCLDLQGNALGGVTIPQGLEDLPHLLYYMGAEGFESHSLQRPKRFDKYRFKLAMEFQKIYAGPSRMKPEVSEEFSASASYGADTSLVSPMASLDPSLADAANARRGPNAKRR